MTWSTSTNSTRAVSDSKSWVWKLYGKIEVEDFPAFIVINHEGKDYYADLTT